MFKKKIFFFFLIILSIFFILFGLLRIMFATPMAEQSVLKIIFSNNDIIYFGDSVLNADHKNTKNASSLTNIFEKYIKKNVLEVSGKAYTPFIYQQYFNVIKKYSNKTKLVIIPINIRAFSSAWNSIPEYQFEQECAYLSIITFKPNMFCLKEHLKNKFYSDYLLKKKNNFYNTPIKAKGFFKNTKNRFMEKFGENCKQTKNNNKIDFSCKNKSDFEQVIDYMQHGLSLSSSIQAMRYNYNYAEVTLPDNFSLLSIKNLVKANLKKNTKILFYVTPVNFDSIKRYSGEIVINIILENLLFIEKQLDQKNIYFLNLVDLLTSEHFDESCACEHVDEEGKKKIAKEISYFIKTRIGNI